MTSKIDIQNLNKLYYTIGEVALMFDVNHSLIRFWEKEFTIIQPKKNKKGNRLFSPKDIENFNKIYHLVKIQGFTLEGAKKELKKKGIASETETTPIPAEAVIKKLEAIKEKLIRLKNSL